MPIDELEKRVTAVARTAGWEVRLVVVAVLDQARASMPIQHYRADLSGIRPLTREMIRGDRDFLTPGAHR